MQFSHRKHYCKQNVMPKATTTTMMWTLIYKQTKQFSHCEHYCEQYLWQPVASQAEAPPPTLSGVDFEISANPVRKLVR